MKKRRLLAGLAAAVMAVFSIPFSALTAAAADDKGNDIQAVFSSAQGQPGKTVSITLSFPVNTGYYSLALGFTWDKEQMSLTNISPDPSTDEGWSELWQKGFPTANTLPIWECDIDTGEIIEPKTPANRGEFVLFCNFNSQKFAKTATDLITFEFTINENAKPGDIDLNVFRKIASLQGAFETVDIEVTKGTVTVSDKVCSHGSLEYHPAKEATCDDDGNETYYVCSDCGAWFKDATGEVEIKDHSSVIKPATDHKWATTPEYKWADDNSTCTATLKCENDTANEHPITETVTAKSTTKAATCKEAGETEYTAEFKNEKFETQKKTVEIEKLKHTPDEPVYENIETGKKCDEPRNADEVIYCKVCKEEISRRSVPLEAGTHTPDKAVKENVVAATCTKDGSYDEVVYCTVCKDEISRVKKTEKSEGHKYDYNNVSYDWSIDEDTFEASCSATIVCGKCGEAVNVPGTVSLIESKDAEYCQAGFVTYTATFSDANIPEETTTIDIPAPGGHKWGAPTWTWDGFTSCIASHTCDLCKEVETEKGKITSSVIERATCTKDGLTRYTARFENFAESIKEDDTTPSAYGHSYSNSNAYNVEWFDDDTKCTMTFTCSNALCDHFEKETVDVDIAVTTQPSCEDHGRTTYTAEFKNPNFSTQYKFFDLPEATGHTPGEPVYENIQPGKTCEDDRTADKVTYCDVCEAEIDREKNVTIPGGTHTPVRSEEIITPVTCTEDGSYYEVYTCSVCDVELSREKKTETAPGHTPGTPVDENVIPATCTNDGSHDEVVYCDVCGEEISREGKTDTAPGHTPGTSVDENVISATCTNDGSHDEVVYCDVCDEELSRETKTDEKLGHVHGDPVKENEKAATEDAEGGYDEVVYCSRCGIELSREQKTTDKLQGGNSGENDPGNTDTDPGDTDPGETDPGNTDPGNTDPDNTDPGKEPSGGDNNVNTGMAASAAGAIGLLIAAAAVTVKKKK